MKLKNKKIIIFVSIGLVLVVSMYFVFNKKNEYKELPRVKLKEQENNKKQFALMIEQTKGEGDYQDGSEEYTNTFPTEGFRLNADMSGCTDINGQEIENALEYDYEKYTITVNTNKTAYCYLYYDIYDKPSAEGTILEGEAFLSKELIGGMYRYQGLYADDIKNYICLGDNCCTTESCPASSDDDMYRIIGITDSGEMKVIKKTALTDAGKWWSNWSTDIKWPESLIYQKLNGKSEGSTDPNYDDANSYYYSLDENLKSKIVNNHSWLYGDTIENTSSRLYNGDTIYGTESGWSDRIEAPLGLMYISDYLYAYKTSDNDVGKPESYTNAKNSWIHLSHNETTHPSNSTSSGFEWTMSYYGFYSTNGSYIAWFVYADGTLNASLLPYELAVRPSFYLSSDIELTGEGSLTEPFRVKQPIAELEG